MKNLSINTLIFIILNVGSLKTRPFEIKCIHAADLFF